MGDQKVCSRIIVCGGRHFDDYPRLVAEIDGAVESLGLKRDEIEVVSGHCAGADQLGERYAEEHEVACKVFPAEWKKYGRAAGPVRNSQMIDYAAESKMPVVVAFVSPNTKGTMDTVNKARRKEFKVFVVPYGGADEGEGKKI